MVIAGAGSGVVACGSEVAGAGVGTAGAVTPGDGLKVTGALLWLAPPAMPAMMRMTVSDIVKYASTRPMIVRTERRRSSRLAERLLEWPRIRPRGQNHPKRNALHASASFFASRLPEAWGIVGTDMISPFVR
jgi:hypothetical protein